jgi:uroporphyrin-III C-methyltransferase
MLFSINHLCFTMIALLLLLSASTFGFYFNKNSFRIQSRFQIQLPSSTSKTQETNNLGSVVLIGAGPGDPDLLTIQALRYLQKASLVVSDRLVSPEILQLITCEIKVANKKPGCAEEAQEEINDWVISAVQQGRHVVRLKIGDPFLFGRGGEEIIEYRKHGIEAKVLPGLSSSYTAPLAALIPLTHRTMSNQVLITTGYGKNGSYVEMPEYHPERTIVLLMAVGRITEIAQCLLSKDYPPDQPVCIIERATTPQQRLIYGTIATIGQEAERFEAKPPATIVIGEVVHALSSSPLKT